MVVWPLPLPTPFDVDCIKSA